MSYADFHPQTHQRAKKIATVILVIGGLLAAGMVWVYLEGRARINECENALERYAVEDGPQPSILTEDWCFDHLIEQGRRLNEGRR
jgi:hypothetical protein